ncbi:MAG TPA: hypothetical protein PLN26_07425 [Acidobacteriota bacterium]|nr:hypothetical protein [Acidobacteriota bacterium]HQG91610.1 hypothetical protein [Acidobacteriota bacterium]
MHPTGHLGKWLCCGCLILVLGGFGLCGMQTRDATNNVTGIWKMSASGISFSTQSDMPDQYQMSSEMVLFQYGHAIFGYIGFLPFDPVKADDKVPRPYPTTFIAGFTANGRIWLYASAGIDKEYITPFYMSVVGRVEEYDTLVAEFILMQFDYDFNNDIDKRPRISEGLGATGVFRAWKQDEMILVPDK